MVNLLTVCFLLSCTCTSGVRINSSNFNWIAALARFWLFWMGKTMRNVMIVVAVLMTSCHVSLKWNQAMENPVLGYKILKKLVRLMSARLRTTSVDLTERLIQ